MGPKSNSNVLIRGDDKDKRREDQLKMEAEIRLMPSQAKKSLEEVRKNFSLECRESMH